MGISEQKMKIVIDNYFRSECDVNTSIKSAFEKGFRIGVIKGQSAQSDLQPTCNQLATDCISRQAAIDAIAHAILFNEFLRAEEAIKNLPSAQPTQITRVNSNESLDCISRQQAINAVIDELDMIDHVPQWVFKKLEGRLKKLPSTQPEITDDQAIKHLQESGWMQNHDKQIYEMGLREQLADDSDSYDSLLPSAQPEPQWIPVSERLPEKPGMYTVTDSKGDVVRFVFQDTESSRRYWLRCAKAWMLLPEPYEVQK